MTEIKEVISKNLRKYRTLAHMSQTELAKQLGISPSSVSNWEQGLNSIDVDTLFRVCKILKVSISKMAESPDGVELDLNSGVKTSGPKIELIKAVEDMDDLQAVAALEMINRMKVYADAIVSANESKKYKQVGQNRFRSRLPEKNKN